MLTAAASTGRGTLGDVGVQSVRYEAEGFGVGELWVKDGVVVWHELPRPDASVSAERASNHPQGIPRIPAVTVPGKGARVRAESVPNSTVALLQAFFRGEDVSFDDVPLDLEFETPFQSALAAALRRVPRGEVVTYGELAALAGRPGAARAAGTFCARNRLAPFVPCHRVVAAGGLGGYGSLGLDYKRRLLALERVAV
jgi:methylated-DNA-[protein]-cysteine S-methyltransferase